MNFLIFVFGLAIGSFLNVLIVRLPQKESILGYSRCPKCRKRISWHENIPVLSFFILKGRCLKCGLRISWQYPLVELLTGFLFWFSFLVFGGNPVFLIYVLFLISLLIVIAFIDLKHLLILDSLILAGFLVSLVFGIWYLFRISDLEFRICELVSCSLSRSLFGILFFAGIFAAIFILSRGRWLGLGDVKMAGWLGFVFGFEKSISIFYLTFFIGFIWAIILLVSKKAGLKSKAPLGSMMALAGALALYGFNMLDFIDFELIFRLWLN